MFKIAIVGAGFSGVAVAVNLLRLAKQDVIVYLINAGGELARGIAYGTSNSDHLLNVPAGNMSLYEELPTHFLDFAKQADSATISSSFVCRKLYGDYLLAALNEAENRAAEGVKLLRLHHTVTSLERATDGKSWRLLLNNRQELPGVDCVVLSLGNAQPADLPQLGSFASSERYLRDPWDMHRIVRLPKDKPVLLIGNGLTAVDVAMTLESQGVAGPIVCVSRRGLSPQPHRVNAPHAVADKIAILGTTQKIRTQVRAFRAYCQGSESDATDWRNAMGVLRPVTAEIWKNYDTVERRRFLRHLQVYWDVHRHRLAPASAGKYQHMLDRAYVQRIAGSVQTFEEQSGGVSIRIKLRGSGRIVVVEAGAVINCTGPCSDPRFSTNPLVQFLLENGLIHREQHGLGIHVAENCAVKHLDGSTSDSVFYIGPWLKADYWEATAVPDLRRFAHQLSSSILKTIS